MPCPRSGYRLRRRKGRLQRLPTGRDHARSRLPSRGLPGVETAGIVIEPTSVGGSEQEFGIPIRGSAEAIADAMRAFGPPGFTNVEVVVWPPTLAALDALAPVIELLDAD